MDEQQSMDPFEQQLIEHVETLYHVALKLTKNPRDAEEVTRTALLQAWQWRSELENRHPLKGELLKLLRRTFVIHHASDGLAIALAAFERNPHKEAIKVPSNMPVLKRPTVASSRLVAAL